MNARQQGHYNEIKAVVESKGGHVISDRYEKMINKMVFQCEKGHQWDTEARSILKGMWCRYCHGNTREQGEASFYERVAKKEGFVVGKYTGNHNQVSVQCKLGHQWEMMPCNLAAGKWCPVCGYKHHGGGSKRFLETLEARKGKLIGTYINTKTRVEVQCDKGHTWHPKPYYIVIGNWCPFCDGSSGENAISLYLTEKGIPYKSQRTMIGLARKRYDFILEEIKTIIEYDGEMHFKFIPYYHVTEEFFKHRQLVDRVKTIHALSSGYRVIRIDYSQLLNINPLLDWALNITDPLCVTTPKLYGGWLLGTTVSPKDIAEVQEPRSRPDYNEDVLDDVAVITNRLLHLVVE